MKLAKIYLSLTVSCFFTPLCLAQNTTPPPPPPPPGISAKEAKKFNEKQQKALEKSQKRSLKEEEKTRKKKEKEPVSVTPATLSFHKTAKAEDVALFFNDYVGKIIKFESVGIYKLEAVRGTNEEMYGIDVTSQESYSRYTSPENKLNFIMPNQLAREVTAEQQWFLDSFPSGTVRRNVNIYAEMRRGEYDSRTAYILCIEFVDRNGIINKKVGSCE